MRMNKTLSYLNRELSWIEFNNRVLLEAQKESVPLLEKLKFLLIVSSNFDEFFKVRLAELKKNAVSKPEEKDISGLTNKEQLAKVSERTKTIIANQYSYLNKELMPQLAEKGLAHISQANYSPEDISFLSPFFQDNIFPILTPVRLEEKSETNHISNQKLNVAFLLKSQAENSSMPEALRHKEGELPIATVQIPLSLPRIIWLPEDRGKKRFTLLENLIANFGTRLFPGYDVEETAFFRLVNDAAFSVDEQRDFDFIQAMEEVLEKRLSSLPVCMHFEDANKTIIQAVSKKLSLTDEYSYEVSGIADISALSGLLDLEGFAELKNAEWKIFPNRYLNLKTNVWDVLKERDVLLNLPYEKFDPVVDLINQASKDAHVLAIKMTLYRTNSQSRIIQALERAARNGKQVSVFVELKARFDEKQNIEWVTRLEQAGVVVIYGIVHIKVHAKLLLIIRKEYEGIKRYAHFSTGNYNESTAKLYSDLCLFTSKDEYTQDATLFFNTVSGYSSIPTLKHLYMAPVNLKEKLLSLIEREIRCSNTLTPGLIMAKMNSLSDKDIIKALYKASQNNVNVLLNVRGICLLVPGVKGQSENISVISIIDRFLEHSRMYYFQNSGEEEIYLSSADCMPRNLERRIELLFPIIDEEVFQNLKDLLLIYFSDNQKAFLLQADGSWKQRNREKGEEKIRAQKLIHESFKKKNETLYNNAREFTVRRSQVAET